MNEDTRPVDGIDSSQFGYETEIQVDYSSPLGEDSQHGPQDGHTTGAQTENGYQGTLSLIEDEYREEYEALSPEWRQRNGVHNMVRDHLSMNIKSREFDHMLAKELPYFLSRLVLNFELLCLVLDNHRNSTV